MNTSYLKLSILFIITVTLFVTSNSHAQTQTIESDTTDYDILYRSNGQQSSHHGSEESLLVSIEDKSIVVEYYRAILEFDISELTGTVDQAVFHVYKEINSSGSDFDIDLYGSTENRDDFISSTESASKYEFFNSNHPYTLLGSTPFITPNDPNEEWYSIDITGFINNRISDYQSTPSDSIVILKLRPDAAHSGNGFGTSYYFGSGNNTNGKEPYLEITPGEITQTVSGNEGWSMLSSPELGANYSTLTTNIWTQGFTGADNNNGNANIYTWNEGNGAQDTTARGFMPISDASQTPDNGKGFLAYVYEDDDPTTSVVDGGFPKTLRISGFAPSGNITPNITLSKQDGTYVSNRDGWNLVGNPFGAKIDWDDSANWTKTNIDNTIYLWDSGANGGNGGYLTWNGSSGSLPNGEIAVWQGFWIKANNNGPPELVISDGAVINSGGGTLYKNRKPASQIALNLTTTDHLESSAYLSFNPKSSLNKDIYDAYKLQSLNNRSNYLYFTDNEQAALEIQSIPDQINEKVSFALQYTINTLQKPLTLGWKAQNTPNGLDIWLTDHKTGQRYDLKKNGSIDIRSIKTKKTSDQKSVANQSNNGPLNPYPKVLQAKNTDSRFTLSITPAANTNNDIPSQVTLEQNYPNPFNPETVIKYSVPSQSQVTLQIYDMLGREVRTLVDQQKSAGKYKTNFNASNLASGLYFYQLKVGTDVLTKKMSVIK